MNEFLGRRSRRDPAHPEFVSGPLGFGGRMFLCISKVLRSGERLTRFDTGRRDTARSHLVGVPLSELGAADQMVSSITLEHLTKGD
jgi:hypothetical protein